MESKKVFAVTGQTQLGQTKIKQLVHESGNAFQCGNRCSEKTDYLIANYPSETRKYRTALEFNVPIITEEEFLDMIKEDINGKK